MERERCPLAGKSAARLTRHLGFRYDWVPVAELFGFVSSGHAVPFPNPGFFVSGTTPFCRLISQWKELMRMYFSPRIRTLVTLCAATALVAMGLPVSAQNARPRTSVPQADLRIKVIVVPAIAPHR